ncbi:zinc-binding dehydrogenase [Martelella alba]|uniref:Zinc-binding dehydrogenase n=1 Tax=Martelella alba TaxID=2590451 RepID=A0A506U7V7_9HYPH|nr:zinc-binding dehydrogenase [Martelella alba]TPW30502.1 zinc-binding dehydrogenase [Martelella alba]
MKAWVQTAFGGAEVREMKEVSRPQPKADEVIIKVAAVALNRLDILQRKAPVIATFRLPHIAGMDFAGTVVEAGSALGASLVGTDVVADPVVTCNACDYCRANMPEYCVELRTCGSSRDGGLAEYVAVPVENCIPVKDSVLPLAELAAVPVASVTAWHGLLGAGRLEAGEIVVIPGANSGLGSAGIQIAKMRGATVITLVSDPSKIATARSLGADLVIDRKAENWVETARAFTGGKGVDIVWDHVGGPFLQQAINACRIGGRVVMSGTTAGNDSVICNTSIFHWGKSLIGHGGYSRQEMADTVAAYSRGDLKLVIDSKWAFEDYPKAEARLESGAFFGKVLVCLTP